MKKVLFTILITAAVTSFSVYYYFNSFQSDSTAHCREIELQSAYQFVSHRIEQKKSEISTRLIHFAEAVAADREFSLTLLAHNDPSAPAVSRAALRFKKPMGFSVLEIADSASTILSSGHFPANAGNSAQSKAEQLGRTVSVVKDNIMGNEFLTLQARHDFTIADFPFKVMGGIVIDETFLNSLSPDTDVKLLLKNGNRVSGMEVRSISEIRDGIIILNDTEYHARSIPLNCSEGSTVCELIVVIEK
ncbi:hypothetical protein CHISP_3424 [Chitinispirillum alkaliphilum]|nr:hypothetical protein CHISP_3424 [Chitinispirillum alkaliphilum]